MPGIPRWRRAALAAALAACVGSVASAPAGAAEPTRAAVLDAAFGETLYAFYQKQYFDAISRVLVARERGEFRQQAPEAELLLGGLYVQYGAPDAATDIFARLLPETAATPQVQRIWLALAELDYRRGRFPDALAVVESRFARESAPEAAVILAVKSLMRMGRYEEAVRWLGPEIPDLPESRYLRFNLAVALVAAGDPERGAQMLSALLAAPAGDDELRALRDRVSLALAATRLQQARAADAVAALALAQLDGPYSNEALLVYGIAALRNNEPRKAIGALLPLATRSPHEQAVQEGWVALAQAYEAAGDAKRARSTYRDALKRLDTELAWLSGQASAIDAGDWFAALERRAGDIALRDDRAGLGDVDVLGLPLHYRQFAGNRFVLAFAQYVEVSRLAKVAVDWQARIPVMDYLVESRVERHGRLAGEAQALLASTPLAPMQDRLFAQATQVEGVVNGEDPRPLATPAQQRLLSFVDEARAKMAHWPERDWSAQKEKVDLLAGVLAWEMARDRPVRAWALQRAVRDNARLVEETGNLRARVQQAAARDMLPVDGWRDSLRAESARLEKLSAQATALRAQLRGQLEDDARDTIRAQRERLVQLAADAYFGIAQIEHGAWRDRRDARRSAAGEAAEGAQGEGGARSSE